MSTRSGKRIHNSFHENTVKVDIEAGLKSERKTRSRRLKENEDHLDITVTVPKSKKRNNYVSYPTEDDAVIEASCDATEDKASKKTRHTLKEQSVNIDTENLNTTVDKKASRVTRQTKKFPDNDDLQCNETEVTTTEGTLANGKVKGKKNKKKKSKSIDNETEDVKIAPSKKSKKKKKGKRSKTSDEVPEKTVFNSSHISTDSFHSAAGSPLHDNVENLESNGKSKELNTTFEKTITEDVSVVDTTLKNESNKRRKSSIKMVLEKEDDTKMDTAEISNDLNSTFDKPVDNASSELDKEKKSRKSLRSKNTHVDENKSTELNNTFDNNENKTNKQRKSSIKMVLEKKDDTNMETAEMPNDLNSTYDKSHDISCSEKLDKEPNTRKSLQSKNSHTEENQSSELNNTFNKNDTKKPTKTISLDNTFDKSDLKLNTTFDKNLPKTDSAKSSLISSDATINVTFDKDNSRVSITSDESKTENIVNTTPVLIESSMDESNLSEKKSIDNINISDDNDTSVSPSIKVTALTTPLKREGTFTKESPAKPKVSLERTPTKRMSLPSPGFTPFHTTHSSQKEKIILNVTRSIEKPLRRSSLAALAPRQTKVMFCSPVNNPLMASQQKKKVIKSSMKGSNKSFVFEDNQLPRPTGRKRSYTHNDVEESRGKRKRLNDELQQSVDRLSRPRTSSATAKLTESTTPTKKPITPLKLRSDTKRTKLPNFAALHQKNFDKMESLDECQLRRARRARQLLTPTGGVAVLERSSPKAVTEPVKPKDSVKKTDTVTKEPQPPKEPQLPTLESLRPGYTRFGFRMHTEFNPFSIPPKTEGKTKEKPNGTRPTLQPKPVLPVQNKPPTLKRQPTLPSLNGTTRKEAAKQTVMREKSFTSISSKRNIKRNESRTIIKGVRTNRRFELQMKMRNVD